eukprot:scaffold282_cov75-Phaeocystis_antarctica.AAC.4
MEVLVTLGETLLVCLGRAAARSRDGSCRIRRLARVSSNGCPPQSPQRAGRKRHHGVPHERTEHESEDRADHQPVSRAAQIPVGAVGQGRRRPQGIV